MDIITLRAEKEELESKLFRELFKFESKYVELRLIL